MHLVTDETNVRFWNNKIDMQAIPYTRHCVEMVSDEMYVALMELAVYDEHIWTISTLLYKIIEQKWFSKN